jgi:hypothetical protein
VFPARFWSNKEQSEALIGLWQNEKLGNVIIYTAHMSSGADKIIRDATQLLHICSYNKQEDRAEVIQCDFRYGLPDSFLILYPASEIFSHYYRRALTGQIDEELCKYG